MKSEFLLAITQLSAEKNLPKEVVISAIEAALVSAYHKDNFAANQNIQVKINPNSGKVEVWAEKTVVDTLTDSGCEISLKEAKKLKPDAKVGGTIVVEATPQNAGRIAAQTAKQVILQRLHEAVHSAIFEEYANKEGDVVTSVVQRVEPGQVLIDLGRTEAVLPASEQVRSERYRAGQRLKVLVLQVVRSARGARVVVSRSHPDLLRRLFELEVPEVYNGAVEIKVIAREAGYRSKVAVAAHQEGVDPVGCCVGLRGIRIQNIVSELNGEKIDVIQWNSDQAVMIANALSPAHIVSVELNKTDQIATVVVPDRQLSLAIGKEGQNARLTAKLTGWRIDIKSVSSVEAEKLAAKPQAEVEAVKHEEPVPAEVPTEVKSAPEEAAPEAPAEIAERAVPFEGVPVEVAASLEPATGEVAEKETELESEEEKVVPLRFFETPVAEGEPQLRFAEDLMITRTGRPEGKLKKKKKKGAYVKEGTETGVRAKKARPGPELTDEDQY